MQQVLGEATRSSSSRGLELLREDPWRGDGNFLHGVRGYAEALPPGTDWTGLREQLTKLVEERHLERTGDPQASLRRSQAEQRQLDISLAVGWARSDLDSAVDWYANELVESPTSPVVSQRTLALLSSVPGEERHLVVDWFERQSSSSELEDWVVVKYVARVINVTPDANIERLVAMQKTEANRSAIVAAYVAPVRKGGRLVLRHDPETLQRLIDAANLSEASRARFRNVMASAVWEEKK